ncbi:hypothetical protein DENSPDRAFT_756256, partial [Dentipellis sp. KUC8613]
PDMQIRCLAHVVNLVVQSILHGIDEAADPDTDDYYETNKKESFHYDINKDEELDGMQQEMISEGESQVPEDDDDLEGIDQAEFKSPIKRMFLTHGLILDITQLRFICTKIVSSPQRRQRFRRTAQEKYADRSDSKTPKALMVIRDVILSKAIDVWVFDTPSLRDNFMLTREDWLHLKLLADMLEVFTKVTLQMSKTDLPTISFALPMYELMRTRLVESRDDAKLPPPLHRAACAGLRKLDKYQDLALGNQYYKLGTILHPHFRTAWFQRQSADASAQAEVLLEHVAEVYHHERQVSVPRNDGSAANSVPKPADNEADNWLLSVCSFDVPLAPTPADESQAWKDEVRRYIKFEGGRGELQDPLGWWKV